MIVINDGYEWNPIDGGKKVGGIEVGGQSHADRGNQRVHFPDMDSGYGLKDIADQARTEPLDRFF